MTKDKLLKTIGEQAVKTFWEFIGFAKKMLQEQNLLSTTDIYEQEYDILVQAVERIDEYKFIQFCNSTVSYNTFHPWIESYIASAINEICVILQLVYPVMQEAEDFITHCNKLLSQNNQKITNSTVRVKRRRNAIVNSFSNSFEPANEPEN